MTDLLINAGGLALMAAIVWWFWLAPGPSGSANQSQHTQQERRP
ncbi:hypothetical protein [Marinobacter sp. SS21]|nr:hypothetical protein [Marinobacter sp. SS21]MDC0662831.1 hypothetical protein [Marinobacter sp. SS21]